MPTPIEFQFLDVGMGDGTLVVMGTGTNAQLALIDFGVQPFTKFKIGADDAMDYLTETIANISAGRNENNPLLDHLYLTHPDQDHYNRILPLISSNYGHYQPRYQYKTLEVKRVTYGGVSNKYNGGLITRFLLTSQVDDLGEKAHSTVNADGSVVPFARYVGDTVRAYLLSSNFPTKSGNLANPRSLCIMFVDADGNKMIFMGDAEKDVEAQIIRNFSRATPGFLNSYGLKLGHHGSLNGTSDAWLRAVRPRAVFASGDFVWAHPYCKTLERVVANGTLGRQPDNHWFCCGKSGKEYFNNDNNLQIFLNLWYVVKEDPDTGLMMKDDDGDLEWADNGTTYGVQWEMDFNGTAAPEFFKTETSVPE